MAEERLIPLPGSERLAPRNLIAGTPVRDDERIGVTVVLRRRAELPEDVVQGSRTLSSTDLAEHYGADPADVTRVVDELGRLGLEVVETDAGSRRILVEGDAAALRRAFGCALFHHSRAASAGGPVYRYRTGQLHVPAALGGIVVAVLGLDNRPQAEARLRFAPSQARSVSYTPLDLAKIYNFPAQENGAGQRLAIIELGGGYSGQELQRYFSGLGVSAPKVTAVSVDGARNAPEGDPNGADGEVVLDVQIAGAMANGADVLVYFAPNSDRGFLNAVSTAAHASPAPTAISISWGSAENAWTSQAREAMNQAFADAAALGVTVTAAAGDAGSSDGSASGQPEADFPAASPYVLACGGTRLVADSGTGSVASETVWNAGAAGGATGGGVSKVFPEPRWQANVNVPGNGRGVPDVAAVADPATGYQVLVDGQSTVVGGTSAVAPLWAALVCRLAQALGRPLGLLQPLIYPRTAGTTAFPGFRDITQGKNGAYSAGPGWDACTGLGVPDGQALLDSLRGQAQPAPTQQAARASAAASVDPEDWRAGGASSREHDLRRERPPHWG
ncbi:MAG: S53 family peptidase [Segniliparus sp.]|uniref:S53 family peptidase n=1 Tax=Segniliparus sp. TaxID=2804064 RepID=UPI003F3B3775